MKLFPFKKYEARFSHFITAILALGFTFSALNLFNVNYLFPIISTNIFGSGELWRYFSYPLIFPNAESAVFSIFAFYYLGTKVEKLLNNKSILLVFGLVAFLEGAIESLLFFRSDYAVKGAMALPFFLTALYLLLYRKSKIRFFFGSIKTSSIALLFAVIYMSSVIYKGLLYSQAYSAQIATSLVIGTALAIIVYAQIRRKQYTDALIAVAERYQNLTRFAAEYAEVYEQEKVLSGANSARAKKASKPREYEFVFDEEELNKVLDKINESGIDSLSAREQKFLEEYSKRINIYER